MLDFDHLHALCNLPMGKHCIRTSPLWSTLEARARQGRYDRRLAAGAFCNYVNRVARIYCRDAGIDQNWFDAWHASTRFDVAACLRAEFEESVFE